MGEGGRPLLGLLGFLSASYSRCAWVWGQEFTAGSGELFGGSSWESGYFQGPGPGGTTAFPLRGWARLPPAQPLLLPGCPCSHSRSLWVPPGGPRLVFHLPRSMLWQLLGELGRPRPGCSFRAQPVSGSDSAPLSSPLPAAVPLSKGTGLAPAWPFQPVERSSTGSLSPSSSVSG